MPAPRTQPAVAGVDAAPIPAPHSVATIVSMAVVASAITSLLHEGLGHGVTAWLRGDIVTQLTSNHLSDLRADRLVDAAGTIVNLAAGSLFLFVSHRARGPNTRYFFWLIAAYNLLLGAGYFLFSGALGLGDWAAFIAGFPHQAAIRTAMAVFGVVLYVWFVRLIGAAARPFIANPRDYNTVARYPYYAACLFWCLAGAFDPLGIKLMFLSTLPASFGGMSGLMWADRAAMRAAPAASLSHPLVVRRSPAWWIAALVLGIAFLATVARGINFQR